MSDAAKITIIAFCLVAWIMTIVVIKCDVFSGADAKEIILLGAGGILGAIGGSAGTYAVMKKTSSEGTENA